MTGAAANFNFNVIDLFVFYRCLFFPETKLRDNLITKKRPCNCAFLLVFEAK